MSASWATYRSRSAILRDFCESSET